jgi:hypothetical protein
MDIRNIEKLINGLILILSLLVIIGAFLSIMHYISINLVLIGLIIFMVLRLIDYFVIKKRIKEIDINKTKAVD